jgi:hypothetical protein
MEEFNIVEYPYETSVPYSAWPSLASSVVQDMAADDDVIAPALTDDITGGVVSGNGGVPWLEMFMSITYVLMMFAALLSVDPPWIIILPLAWPIADAGI